METVGHARRWSAESDASVAFARVATRVATVGHVSRRPNAEEMFETEVEDANVVRLERLEVFHICRHFQQEKEPVPVGYPR